MCTLRTPMREILEKKRIQSNNRIPKDPATKVLFNCIKCYLIKYLIIAYTSVNFIAHSIFSSYKLREFFSGPGFKALIEVSESQIYIIWTRLSQGIHLLFPFRDTYIHITKYPRRIRLNF